MFKSHLVKTTIYSASICAIVELECQSLNQNKPRHLPVVLPSLGEVVYICAYVLIAYDHIKLFVFYMYVKSKGDQTFHCAI